MACCLSMGTMVCYRGNNFNGPSASLSLLTGSITRTSVSLNVKAKAPTSSGMLLQSALTPPLSFFLFRLFILSTGMVANRRCGLVVRAAKYALCQTKRNRSRNSLARTHGFRKRMSTTRGRAVIRRRRAKGQWNLCTKSNPNGGKRA